MTTPRETYEYCEELIRQKIANAFYSRSTFSNEERTITFSSSNARFDQLKTLYKHLENIQNMKTSYLSGR